MRKPKCGRGRKGRYEGVQKLELHDDHSSSSSSFPYIDSGRERSRETIT